MPRTTKKTIAPIEKHTIPTVPVAEQPYQVPENWRWVRLGEIYVINPPVEGDDSMDVSFVPMEKVNPGMCSDFTFDILPWKQAKKGHTRFANGDIAFAKISPCFENRKAFIATGLLNGIGGGTTELIILRHPKILQKYTYYSIMADRFINGGVQTYSGTVGQQRISMDYVRNYPFPLPPLAEQQRIVDRIERLFAKLDEAREKAQAVVDGFENRKATILHKAFTGELTKKWREERGIGINTWQNTTLSTVVDGFKYGTSEKSDYSYLGMPVLRIPNIGDDGINFSDIKYLSTEAIDYSDQIHENDILIIRSNGSRELVGKCILVPPLERAYTYASFLIRITPSKFIQPTFLEKYLNSSDARSQMLSKAKSSAGINNINTKELGGIIIHLPTLQEQTEIVSTIQKLIQQEQRARDLAESVIAQIDGMKKAILARAFRGELGTNVPGEAACEV